MDSDRRGGKTALSVLVVALVISFYLFCNSQFFLTDSVKWTGLVHLNGEQLDMFLALPPTNVWRLSTKELSLQLQEHPWVKKAEVFWRWPNRIVVEIGERVPVCQLPAEGSWLFLDKEGNILPCPQGVSAFSLPVVTNLNLESKEQLISTARLMDTIPAGLKEDISEWNVASRSFVSRGGTEILMGQPVELEQKFLLLETILNDLASRGERAARIDLRVTKNPVVSTL